MVDLILQRGQVPLAPASFTSGTSLGLPHSTISSAFFSQTSQASTGFSAFSDTPPALLASEIDIPATTRTEPVLPPYTNDPVTGKDYSSDIVSTSNISDSDNSLMKQPGRKCFGGFLALSLSYLSLSGLALHLNKSSNPSEARENAKWIASSNNWFDRQLCRWVGLCGALHLTRDHWTWDGIQDDIPPTLPDISDWWTSAPEDPDSWSSEERLRREIPQYVWDHAPYVHLFSKEKFWPCDLAEHHVHTSPHLNYTKVMDLDHEMNLTNLADLNDIDGSWNGQWVWLHSDDNVEERPEWLLGRKNIPKSPEILVEEGTDATWPDSDDSLALDAESTNHEAVAADDGTMAMRVEEDDSELEMSTLSPSPNGKCGGKSGFTCKGSKFGACCSIYGWCGKGEAYCGEACNAVAGKCKDPWKPFPRPHSELRRNLLDLRGRRHKNTTPGRSSAPAFLFVVPKEDGIVDAFWFFFYSFNQGQTVFGIRFGNHVGDWEHTCIRFKHGKPISVFLSEHDFGDAYSWNALEKYIRNPDESGTMIGTWSNQTASKLAKRPVIYSAEGSHAMYATPGLHPYILPWGLLHDQTDRGPLWDPALNVQAYTYDFSEEALRSSTHNPKAPTDWFHFAGHWGDKFYPLSDSRQYRFAGQYHYVNGPTGPKDKFLDRKRVCQRPDGKCHIRDSIDLISKAKKLLRPLNDDVEEGTNIIM